MRIEKVITNINGKKTSVEPKKVNIFLDKNGAGKTSFLRATLWGLTGEKIGTEDAEVMVQLDPSFKIGRIRKDGKNACFLNGNKVTEKALNAALEERFETEKLNVDMIKLAASEAVLEATKPEELLKALLDFVPEELNVEKIIDNLTSTDEKVIEKVREIFPVMPTTFSINDLQEVYKNLYDERRLLSADYKQKVGYYKQLEMNTRKPTRGLEEISEELVAMQVAERNAADILKRKQQWMNADNAEKKRLQEMETLKTAAMAITFKGHTAEEQKEREENRAKTEADIVKLASQKATVKSNIEIFEKTLKSLDQPVCPISNKLVCTTDKTGIKAELEKSVSDNQKLLEDIVKKEEACKAALDNYKIWKEQRDKDLENYQKKLQIMERYKALQEHPVLVPEKPEDMPAASSTNKVASLKAEKTNCENFMQMQKLLVDIREEESKIKVLDYLVNAFKDKGEVKEKIINNFLDIFEATINERAALFCPGYSVELSASAGFKVALKTPYNDKAYDISTLSGGERLITRFLLLDMLNALTGTNIMFIDNVEALDVNALTYLSNILKNDTFRDAYDHVFIAGVNHPDVCNKLRDC